MPASFHIDVERRLILSSATDVVTEEDLTQHRQRLVTDPDFDSHLNQLWDFTEVTEIRMTSADVRKLADYRSFETGVQRAIVASTDVSFGLARMFQSMHDTAPEQLRVFRSRSEAEAWLGLPGSQAPRE